MIEKSKSPRTASYACNLSVREIPNLINDWNKTGYFKFLSWWQVYVLWYHVIELIQLHSSFSGACLYVFVVFDMFSSFFVFIKISSLGNHFNDSNARTQDSVRTSWPQIGKKIRNRSVGIINISNSKLIDMRFVGSRVHWNWIVLWLFNPCYDFIEHLMAIISSSQIV